VRACSFAVMTDPTAAAVPARFIGMPARDYPLDTVRHCQSCCNYRAESPAWSLGAGVVGMVGAVVLAVLTLISPAQNGAAVNFATWAAFFLSPLVFGFLALRHPRADIPRILAIIGIVGGVFGLLNLVLTLIAGGDWSKPNNPALTPLLLGTYYLAMLPTLAWMVWTGIAILLRRK
jgi:hypothetical protein